MSKNKNKWFLINMILLMIAWYGLSCLAITYGKITISIFAFGFLYMMIEIIKLEIGGKK